MCYCASVTSSSTSLSVSYLAQDHSFTFQSSLIPRYDNSPRSVITFNKSLLLCTAGKVCVCVCGKHACIQTSTAKTKTMCVYTWLQLPWEWSNWLTVSSTVYLDTTESYRCSECREKNDFLLHATGQSSHRDLRGMSLTRIVCSFNKCYRFTVALWDHE